MWRSSGIRTLSNSHTHFPCHARVSDNSSIYNGNIFDAIFGNRRIDAEWVKSLPQSCGETRSPNARVAGSGAFESQGIHGRCSAPLVYGNAMHLSLPVRLPATKPGAGNSRLRAKVRHLFSDVLIPQKWVGQLAIPHVRQLNSVAASRNCVLAAQ